MEPLAQSERHEGPSASLLRLSLLLWITFLAAPHAHAQTVPRRALTAGETAKLVTPSVVTITTPTGIGSGVVVGATGVVLTSLHVVQGDATASVRLANGDIYDDVQVLDVDSRKDLVVLKIKAFGLSAARLGDSETVAVGDAVFAFGSPSGLQSTLSNGLVSAIRDSGEGYRLIQTTAAVSPGSSGGALFNTYGELVGIVASKLPAAESVNFAIPINYARGLLASTTTSSLGELAQRFPAVAGSSVSSAAASAPGATSASAKAALESILKQTGFTTITPSGDGWRTTFKGEHAESVTVYVRAYDDLAFIQSQTIADLPMSNQQLELLLKKNFEADLVKLGVTDGALRALAESEIRTLDVTLLKRLVLGVADLADTVFGELDPVRESPPIRR